MCQIFHINNAQIFSTQRDHILFDLTTTFGFHKCPTQYLTFGADQSIQKGAKCLYQSSPNHLFIPRPHLAIH